MSISPPPSNRTGMIQTAAQTNDVKFIADLKVADPFWDYSEDIDTTRWDKAFPYQLMILKAKSGSYEIVSSFVLPIPPQEMTISTPFASTVSATLGGVVEEHNGAPFRQITCSGTTGINPGRTRTNGGTQLSLGSIFAGSVSLGSAVNSAITTAILEPENVEPDTQFETGGDLANTTGYYQFRLLERFLEGYANLQKFDSINNYRLAFCVWKNQAVYLVTPFDFSVRRDGGSPLEYRYSLQFRAWKRINFNALNTTGTVQLPTALSPGGLATIIPDVAKVTSAINKSVAVLNAAVGGIGATVTEACREVSMFVRIASGAALTVAELPQNLISAVKTPILATFSGKSSLSIPEITQQTKKTLTEAAALYQSGADISAHPVNAIFSNPSENHDFFATINVGSLPLPIATQLQVNKEQQRVRALTRSYFENLRNTLVTNMNDVSEALGAGSATYNATYGKPAPKVTTRTPTDNEWDILFAMNNLILQVNKLAATTAINIQQTSPMEYVAGLATRSSIVFKVPRSKFSIPFPYGFTLEKLAQIYLGDPDRWMEIATLNGLRDPYVDEEGFYLPLLTNGNGNEVLVAKDPALPLFMGQPVTLVSSGQRLDKRTIISIEDEDAGYVTVTVDGDSDLDKFSTMAGAKLHAFQPDTANSQMMIYIPSDKDPAEDDFLTKSIPGLKDVDNLLNVGGVDLLLTQSGDLAVTQDGDCKLAIGLANLVQRVKIALSTKKGSLLRHPQFGINLQLGANTADINVQDTMRQIKSMFANDPSFTGVKSIGIRKVGPGITINLSIGIAGTGQNVPISLNLRP